jgi:benzoate membrane transport protein
MWTMDRRDLPALVTGFVVVLVGFTSSVALVFQAAQALQATAAQTASWMLALGLGMGLSSVFLSWRYRQPVLTAWSTPGAALIAASHGVSVADATGAFLLCGLLITVAGYSGLFTRVMNRIPVSIAAALLAALLARFGLDAVRAAPGAPWLVGTMLLTYLLVGVLMALGLGMVAPLNLPDGVGAAPVWVQPTWHWPVLLGLGVPLFVVTMASQNLPGVAAMRAGGVHVPLSKVIGATGLTTLALAPFGGYAFNLSAITAAIVMSPESHEDPNRRWLASATAGVIYLAVGLAGAAVVGVFAVFPKALVLAVAALALLGTIGNGLAQALHDEKQRDAAVLTFLVGLSGVSVAGIGAAFWAVLAGALALALRRP